MSIENELAALLDEKLAPLVDANRQLVARIEELRRDLPRQLYTVAEAAAMLGVHRNTIRAWAKSGKLPSRRIGGSLRIDLGAAQNPASPEDIVKFTGSLRAL